MTLDIDKIKHALEMARDFHQHDSKMYAAIDEALALITTPAQGSSEPWRDVMREAKSTIEAYCLGAAPQTLARIDAVLASQPSPAATVETKPWSMEEALSDGGAAKVNAILAGHNGSSAGSIKAPFRLRRYVNGVEMAEDVEITNASTVQEAFTKARALYGAPKGMDLVLECSPTEPQAVQVTDFEAAQTRANESASVAPNSYGAGYDRGYADAIKEVQGGAE